MNFTLNISILYQCKIAENGYEIKNGKITTRFNNSRYMLKNFNLDCIKDFKSIFMNKNDNDKSIDKKRENFANLWGVFNNEHEKIEQVNSIINFIIDIENSKNKKYLPPISDSIEFGWKYSNNGKLLPVIDAINLLQAIKIALHLNSELDLSKTCYYFLNFGERKDCKKSFKPKRSDAIFCSAGCRDHYHKKQMRRNINIQKITQSKNYLPKKNSILLDYGIKTSILDKKNKNKEKGVINSFIQFPILRE